MSSTAPLVRVEVPEALDKWKSWAKLLQRVDTSRKDGYAFEGPWLRRGRLDELPVGALVLLYDEVGSRRYHIPYVHVVRVEPDGTLALVSDEEGPLRAKGWDWALLLRDRVARLLGSSKTRPLAGMATDDLAQESPPARTGPTPTSLPCWWSLPPPAMLPSRRRGASLPPSPISSGGSPPVSGASPMGALGMMRRPRDEATPAGPDAGAILGAAVAAWQGDLGPALQLLRQTGRESARLTQDGLRWGQERGLPGGALPPETDPFTALALLGFALYGMRWPQEPAMRAAWAKAGKAWQELRRPTSAGRRTRTDGPMPQQGTLF